jgi:hypothetical protein
MREEEEGAAVVLIKKKGGGLKTAGPRRFASRAAAVRTMGRHVAERYTRENRRPHGGTHGIQNG